MNCEDWLKSVLRKGPVFYREIKELAKIAGYTKGQLREARRVLGVKSTNRGKPLSRTDRLIYWSLPQQPHK